jgi:hypothetical protein
LARDNHIPDDAVRNYLLGVLPENQASIIEEKYFTDRSFFRHMQASEEELIGEYLAGRLPAPEKNLFERRYLRVPQLQTKLREVRSRHQTPRAVSTAFPRWKALAFAGALGAIAIAVWVSSDFTGSRPAQVAQTPPATQTPIASYRLTPGVQMSPGGAMTRIPRPPAGERVRLILELPGVASPVDSEVRLLSVGADGRTALAWKTQHTVRSQDAPAGQQIEVLLGHEALLPHDYIVEVAAPGGAVREKYLFRVQPD